VVGRVRRIARAFVGDVERRGIGEEQAERRVVPPVTLAESVGKPGRIEIVASLAVDEVGNWPLGLVTV